MITNDITTKIINAAYNEAVSLNHEYFMPEHILYSSLFFEKSIKILQECGVEIEKLKDDLQNFFSNKVESVNNATPVESNDLIKLFENSASHSLSSGKEEIDIGNLFVSIFTLEHSFAKYFLEKHGVTKLCLMEAISHNDFDTKEDTKIDKNEEDEFIYKYAVNLTEMAINGKLDPIIGREDILQRTLQVLIRRLKNNPIHTGEPGVGKTAISEGIAQLIAKGKVPSKLKNSQLYRIDLSGLVAGTKYRGDFEKRIKKLLDLLEKKENAIIYIDEIHNLVGAGATTGSTMDASNILKPYLLSGKLRFIGSTTFSEFKKYFEKDSALNRRFQRINVPETTKEETLEILYGLKNAYEKHHNVKYSNEAISCAVDLSIKYLNDKFLPDKAIDVIDEAGAKVRLFAESDKEIIITEKEIEETVSIMAAVPKQSMSSDEIKPLKELDKKLLKDIFGQENAVNAVVKAVRRSRAGFNNPNKPVASLLFIGPTGVGKTELSKRLAYHLGIPFIRFDMSEYQEKHSVARLIGSPPGYVGYEEGGLLTDAIRKNPYSVLLLDEIEKAHEDIYNILLQAMDYSTITDNTGKKADLKNIILIMTSNAGAKDIERLTVGFGSSRKGGSNMIKYMEKIFSPEFRNRLDDVVIFNSMSKTMAMQIADKNLKEFARNLKEKNIKLTVRKKCLEYIAEKALESIYGAREIHRIIQQKIKDILIDEVLFGKLSKGGKISLNEKCKITIKV
jgi:ATP-dependent Clp protease ATP-binding subunit ClpA